MGMGATNAMDRVAASIGAISSAPLSFTPCADIPFGGVLLAVGLFSHTKDFFQEWKKGYYALETIFLF